MPTVFVQEHQAASSTAIMWQSCSNCDWWVTLRKGGEYLGLRNQTPYDLVDLAQSSSEDCEICTIIWSSICLNFPACQDEISTWAIAFYFEPSSEINVVMRKKGAFQRGHDVNIMLFCDDVKQSPDSLFWGSGKYLPAYDGSEHSIRTISDWIHHCSENHPICIGPGKTILPRRVLDIKPSLTAAEIVLFESEGVIASYAALSHCWGKMQIITTTKETMEQRKTNIPISLLSNTFRDAVTLCRQLDIRYLWIDSLCIVQDDPDDWEVESSKMASTYGNALLTIAATQSSSGAGGCFSHRPPTYQIQRPIGSSPRPTVLSRIKLKHIPWETSLSEYLDSAEQFPLMLRSWCFQERLLGPRVLHFAHSEMVWDCRDGVTCECGKLQSYMSSKSLYSGMLSGAKSTKDPTQWTHDDVWRTLVMEYSQKQITYRKDILPAFSGIARQFSMLNLGRYLAGIWEKTLTLGLLWYSVPQERNERHWNQRPEQYIAPTWSWASVVGRVAYNLSHEESAVETCVVEVLSANSTPKGIDKFGQCVGGELALRAPAVHAELRVEKQTCLYRRGLSIQVHVDTSQDLEQYLGTQVICLRFFTFAMPNYSKNPSKEGTQEAVGLVLAPSGDASSKCSRIGMFTSSMKGFWDGEDLKTVEIV